MSRIGKNPIPVPAGVKVSIENSRVLVEGPKGKMESPIPEGIQVSLDDSTLELSRSSEVKSQKALHGLARALLANAVTGVTEGFKRDLDVVGIGYKAEMRGKFLHLAVGFSHPIEFPVPEGIKIDVERVVQRGINNYVGTIKITGIDKAQVGQVAADLRRLKPPDAYKGKGIRYSDETVRLKVGKKGA